MRKIFAVLLLLFTGLSSVVAQDIITLKSGNELKARILRLNPKDVTFIPENKSDTLSMARNEITKLLYQGGTVIYLSEEERITFNNEPGSDTGSDSLYILGEKDAIRFYKGYKPAATGTLICSIFIPWGLIPAIACSSSPPKINSLDFRNNKLMENPGYYKGYTDKAFKIKKKKVWQNFAIGSGITVGCYILMAGVLFSML